jgi:serine protease Do
MQRIFIFALGGLLFLTASPASVPAQVSSPTRIQAGSAIPSAASSALALEQAGRELATIVARVNPSVVHIDSTRQKGQGTLDETGSGVIMSSPRSRGLFVVTNRHVVADAQLRNVNIKLHDGRVIHPTEKLEDPDSDLAVLKIDAAGIEPVIWGDSDNLDIGHFVIALGSPFGLSQSVTLGIISAKGRRALELPGRRVINQDFLQTDAAINPGNSGGPLIDLYGRLVGINTAIASQGGGNEGIGFSIPSNLVRFVVEQLLESGRVRRGYLGVELDENFDFEKARWYSLDRLRGARVTRVIDNTPASRAGIRADDIILNFDGVEVEDENDLINRVSLTPINKTVRLVVMRRGEEIALQITLTERGDPRGDLPKPVVPPNGPALFEHAGLSVLELTGDFASQLKYAPSQRGLLVTRLDSTSPADAEIQLYDVIEEVARQPVKTPEDFLAAIQQIPPGSSALIKVRRLVNGHVETRLVLWNPATPQLAE